jgi:Tol biopolymer transport system component/tetratricopeptide (TPR) repeat protein
MRCPECKTEVPDHLSLCPVCGEMVQDTRPMRTRSKELKELEETQPLHIIEQVSEPEEPQERPAIWPRVLTIFLAIVGALLILGFSVGLGGYFGLYQGEEDRRQAEQAQAREHYQKGESYLEQGTYKLAVAEFEYALGIDPNLAEARQRIDEIIAQRYLVGLQKLDAGEYELAIDEFDYILRIDPDHAFAKQGIEEAEARIAARPTPTPEFNPDQVVKDLYQKAVDQYQAEEWADAAATLTQVRAVNPAYEAQAVEDMLFNSLYNAGMVLLEEDRFEEGIFYLDQAIALRPDDPTSEEAQWERDMAEFYMIALGYWGVDWELCIERFEQLYAMAPGYKDVYQKLYGAHVAYGDEWYAKEEMCPAQKQYDLALQLAESADIMEKRNTAEQVCLVATPAPIAMEDTDVITLTQLPPGFATGRLAYPSYNADTSYYSIFVLSTDRRIVRWATGADQPGWMRSSGTLGYRNHVSAGISLLTSEAAAPQQLLSGSGLAWPAFSPVGERMTYAAQDASGTWQIYIAPTDGSAEPQVHAQGKWPAWAPNGWLAWTGCNDGGECGIFIDNPDNDEAPIQLSTSTNDIALNWHPDSGSLIYMANHTGNWEIYRVYTDRRFVQLTDDPASDGLPVWSPDGSKVAFVSDRSGEWGVYLMNADGADPHIILELGPDLPGWTSQRLSWGQ